MRNIYRTRNALFVTLCAAGVLLGGVLLGGCGGSGTDHIGDSGGGTTPGAGVVDLNVAGVTTGSNVDMSAFHATSVTGRQTTSALGTQLNVSSTDRLAIPNRTIVATMLDATAPAVGKIYVIGGSNPNTLVYTEVVSPTETHSWNSSGGQMRVTAIDGNKVTLAVEASMDDPGAGAIGSFTLSGTVVIDDVTG